MENADQLTEEMSELHDHSRNYIGKVRIELCAKSFILQVYDVLARHTAEWNFCVAQVVRTREIIVRLSSGGILGKNPVKCLFEVVKNANSLFTQGFSKYHKHSG